MYCVDLDPILCRIIEMYRHVGVWRSDGESEFRKSCMRILYFLQYFSLFVYLSIGAYQAYLIGDTNQLIFLVDTQIHAIIILIKAKYLLWRKDEILQLLYDPIMNHHTEYYSESVFVKEKIRKITAINTVYSLFLIIGFFFLILLPLPAFSRVEKLLPYFIRYNNEEDVVLYWIVYVYGSIGCFFCAVYTYLTLIIWYIMYNYSLEYNLLGRRFRSLGTTTPNTYHQDLIQLIRKHKRLFHTIERFRSFFSVLFMLEIFTGAISICVSTYSLAYNNSENVLDMAFFLIFLLYAFLDTSIIMYLANQITIESDLFESNWIDQLQYVRKKVLIFGEMVRRPQQMVVFVYPMNLEKLTSIVNGSYSMFNLLQRFK